MSSKILTFDPSGGGPYAANLTLYAGADFNATFNVVSNKLAIDGTAITATAAELNIIDSNNAASSIGSIDDADKFCRWLLEDFDLNGETLMVAPAAGFYSTPNKGINQVRIAYVLNKKSLQRSIDILESALKVYPGRLL